MIIPVFPAGRLVRGASGPVAPSTMSYVGNGARGSAGATKTVSLTIPAGITNPVGIFVVSALDHTNALNDLSASWAGSALTGGAIVSPFPTSTDVSTPVSAAFGVRNLNTGAQNFVLTSAASQIFTFHVDCYIFPAAELHPSVFCIDTPINTTASANSNNVTADITITEPAYLLVSSGFQGNDGGTPTINGGYTADFAGQIAGNSSTTTDITALAAHQRATTTGTYVATVNYPGASDGRGIVVVPVRGK